MNFGFDLGEGPNHAAFGHKDVVSSTVVKIGNTRRQIVFHGLKSGETTVILRNTAGEVVAFYKLLITPVDFFELGRSLSKLLERYSGIRVERAGDRLAVVGFAETPEDYGDMLAAVTSRAYADYVINQVRLSPQYWVRLAAKAQVEASKVWPHVQVRPMENFLLLEGSVPDQETGARVGEKVKLLLPGALPGDRIQEKDPAAKLLPPRSLIQNFLKITGK